MANNFLRSLGLVSAIALVPAATAGLAQVDAGAVREIDQFMSVLERVKAEYVDQVTDEQLIRGAIDGMLNSLDPHSSYLDARGFRSADDHHRRQLWRPRPHRHHGGRRGEGDRRDPRHARRLRPGSSRATSSPISTAGCSTAARSTRRSSGCAARPAPAFGSPSSARAASGRSTSTSPARSSTFRRCAGRSRDRVGDPHRHHLQPGHHRRHAERAIAEMERAARRPADRLCARSSLQSRRPARPGGRP